MAITNPDKVVTKQDLADFYQELLPYLGGNLPVMGEINKSDIYSTTEKVVGCWTDGKPIYQMSIILSNGTDVIIGTPAGTWTNLCAVPSGADRLLDYKFVTSGGTSIREAPIFYRISGGYLQWYAPTAYANYNSNMVTIWYTKSTDAANSYNYADENDYSTTEKIVGTWIDGKTIYQRTFTGTLGSNGASNLITSFSSKCIKYFGFQHGASGSASFDVVVPCINSYADSNNSCVSYGSIVYVENSNLTYKVIGKNFSMFANQPYYITVQYTKS